MEAATGRLHGVLWQLCARDGASVIVAGLRPAHGTTEGRVDPMLRAHDVSILMMIAFG
jgi:hypothetical protein